MKNTYLIMTAVIFALLLTNAGFSQNSGDSEVSVSVDRECSAAAYDFRFTTNVEGDQGFPLIGTGGTGYFSFLPYNQGEMAYISENISIYWYNISTDTKIEKMDLSAQNANTEAGSYYENYLFNSTNFNADSEFSRLLNNDTVLRAPYWYDTSFDNWNETRPGSLIKQKEFIATTNFTDGVYQSELEFGYACEFAPRPDSTVEDASNGESFNFSSFNPSNYNQSEILNDLLVDGLNVSVLEKNDAYAQTVNNSRIQIDRFKVVSVQGNGSTPDEVSDTNEEIGRNLETDADEVSNLSKNSSLNNDVNESVNSSRETSANTTTDFERNSSLESDANQTSDATEVEGNNPNQPGQTPVPEPEPEPEPDPQPLLSVSMRPLNSTYTTSRGRFAEIGLEVSNVGEEAVSNMELSPRFSEGMDWDAQSVNIDSLGSNESVNESVFVRANEGVDPGMYQIPVFASNEESDIGSQYVDVEVTENITRASTLSIAEAPQDIRFEVNQNYTVPVLLENAGEEALENVQIELQNTENCGSYNASQIESIAAGETASVSVDFQTSDSLQECEATIVASSDSGSFSFSRMNVENVEEKGVVPQEFRVPIVASLWTLMLIIYTVVFKRYNLDNVAVKLPLIILIAGEVFILIYLSSAYYEVIPSGLLPFTSA